MNDERAGANISDAGEGAPHTAGEFTALPNFARRHRRRTIAPADGERNAIFGFSAQYEFAAARTLDSLRAETLQWIRLADVAAGRVDDFQIGIKGRVDAYQIKWARTPGAIGFGLLCRDSSTRTSYLAQLADAWVRIRNRHPGQRVVVHFVTNEAPSGAPTPRTILPRSRAAPRAEWSLAAFLREAWGPATVAARSGVGLSRKIPARWRPAWSVAKNATQLSASEFVKFLADCEIEFGAIAPETDIQSQATLDLERQHWLQDIQGLVGLFMRWVARGPTTEMLLARLLAELGWETRVQPRHVHEFPLPDIPYRGIVSTAEALESELARLKAGYVALVGSPGSGKSTLLTRTLRQLPDRIIRYYAYVPNMTNVRRGEANNFLHDVSLALHRSGIRSAHNIASNDHELLAQRFEAQLGVIHNEYKSSGRRTIILVDGLDHIEREQNPTRSLLRELPVPTAVPEGVLFVLGSQTDKLQGLSPRIREHLDEDGRRLAIAPLARTDVIAIVEAADLPISPTDSEKVRIADLSGGHPLALNYIINRLRLSPKLAVTAVLDKVEPYAETIDDQYRALWDDIHHDVALVRLLALVARMRDRARIDWVAQWSPAQAVHELTEDLAHLFRRERGNRWTFFHNSFRAYVVSRTRGLLALGDEASLFRELAQRCADAAIGDVAAVDELWYRWHCGEHDVVLHLSNRETFRQQLLAGRPVNLIEEDAALGLAAAVALRDVVGTTQQLLLASEIRQRAYYVGMLPLAETYLELRNVDIALDSLGSETNLWTDPENALSVAAELDKHGVRNEAERVFLQAEPIAELRSVRERLHGTEEDGLLAAWAKSSPRFRPLSDILDAIQNVRAEGDPFHVDARAGVAETELQAEASLLETVARRKQLLQSVRRELDELKRWDDADVVLERLRECDDNGLWWFWNSTEGWRRAANEGENERARIRFASLLRVLGTDDRGEPRIDSLSQSDSPESRRLTDDARVALAEGFLRLSGNTMSARRMVQHVRQPPRITSLSHAGSYDGLEAFSARYLLNRVLGALGDVATPESLVPLPLDGGRGRSRERGDYVIALFECSVIRLARLDAASWTSADDSTSFGSAVRPLLRTFDAKSHLATGAYVALSARGEFFKRLVSVARAHGPDCVKALCEELAAEWREELRDDAWPLDLIREILLHLSAGGAPASWVASWLTKTEPLVFEGSDLESQLPLGIKQVQAWVAVGDMRAARRTLQLVLSATFGNENKDTQIAWWIQWAERANRTSPLDSPQRLARLAAAASSLEASEALQYVREPLVAAGFGAGARIGLSLLQWCFNNGVDGWVNGTVCAFQSIFRNAPRASDAMLDFFANLTLPFATQPHYQLVHDLTRECGAQHRETFASIVAASALGSTRVALQQAIAGGAAPIRDDQREATEDQLKAYGRAFPDRVASEREIRDRVTTVADVSELFSRVDSDSYSFPWEPLLMPFVNRAATDELAQLVDIIPTQYGTWRIHARIAERLAGEAHSAAERAARRIIDGSSASGWSDHYDGGSRLRGYELLVGLLGDTARNEAWNDLFAALDGDAVSIHYVLGSWTRIVPVLVSNVNDVAIWNEISGHVEALVRHAPSRSPPALPDAYDPGDSVAAREVVTTLAASVIDHHARALATGAQLFFVDRLVAGDVEARRTIADLLSPNAPELGVALRTLRAAAMRDADCVAFADKTLTDLHPARDYVARREAEALRALRKLPEPADAAPPALRQLLPPVFQVQHPTAHFRVPDLPAHGELLPLPIDALDLIRLYSGELRIIARMAGVQPEALFHSVAQQVAKDQGQPNFVDEEPAARDEMEGLNLQIPYIRPRSRLVARAMSAVVTMLIDRGWLTRRHFSGLDILLRAGDPEFLATRPFPRPAAVPPIREREAKQYFSEGWTAAVAIDDCATGKRDLEGWIIVAEESWMRWLDWKLPVETRAGAMTNVYEPLLRDEELSADSDDEDPERRPVDAMRPFVADAGPRLASEYATIDTDPHVVVRSDTTRFETPNSFWLALNPKLARHLKWKESRSGLFQWTDSNGDVMAESLWWQDGFADQRPPEFHDEVGFGWLVRVSPKGWAQLKQVVGPSAFVARIERSSREDPPKAVARVSPA